MNEAITRGHSVSVLDIDSESNRRSATRLKRRGGVAVLGDIRKQEVAATAVEDHDAVIHLAAVLPPASEANPQLCRSVNIGGTEVLLSAATRAGRRPVFVLVSSASVMGPTQYREPPISVEHTPSPNDEYARSKLAAEQLTLESGLQTCVLRLAAVLLIESPRSPAMAAAAFDLPLDARCEVVADIDVATACVTAAGRLASERSKISQGLREVAAAGQKPERSTSSDFETGSSKDGCLDGHITRGAAEDGQPNGPVSMESGSCYTTGGVFDMGTEVLHVVFRYLHILGAAAVAGGLLAELGAARKEISGLVVHGAATQLITGLVLLFLTLADADHIKITVKTALLAVLLVLFVLQRKRGTINTRTYRFDLGIVLVIIAVAVFWRDYGG